MPTQIQVMNRYVPGDPVVGAAITFDHDNEDVKTPRTAANGFVTVSTEGLSDGNHVVRITPRYTSDLQVGPDIAEDLDVSVTRMFRSLEVGITVLKGKVQGCVPAARPAEPRGHGGANESGPRSVAADVSSVASSESEFQNARKDHTYCRPSNTRKHQYWGDANLVREASR